MPPPPFPFSYDSCRKLELTWFLNSRLDRDRIERLKLGTIDRRYAALADRFQASRQDERDERSEIEDLKLKQKKQQQQQLAVLGHPGALSAGVGVGALVGLVISAVWSYNHRKSSYSNAGFQVIEPV
jgi:hypothetical protein